MIMLFTMSNKRRPAHSDATTRSKKQKTTEEAHLKVWMIRVTTYTDESHPDITFEDIKLFTTETKAKTYAAKLLWSEINEHLECYDWNEEKFIHAVERSDLHVLDPPDDADPEDYSPYEQFVMLKPELKEDFDTLTSIIELVAPGKVVRPVIQWSVEEVCVD